MSTDDATEAAARSDLARPEGHAHAATPRDAGPGAGPGGRAAPALGPRGLGRWAWRQLTSMRTALVLLFLLALGSIPGSIVPQDSVDPFAAATWRSDHPTLAGVYSRLGLFSVYDSAWFSAIYLLLMVSLVGCILPRTRHYWRGYRARPPRAPRHLSRMPGYARVGTDAEPSAVLERAEAVLSGRHRLDRVTEGGGADREGHVAAERGQLREAGNLLFHVSLLLVLVGVALGTLLGYTGSVIVVTGQTFANSLSQYDQFRPGGLFEPTDLQPFSLEVSAFDVQFIRGGPSSGLPRDFEATVRVTERPGATTTTRTLAVNHPLELADAEVFLVGHGYAPEITVRDGNGRVAYSGPTVFLPQNQSFESFGVVKVPDAKPQQLGLQGLFYPTYAFVKGEGGGPTTLFPDAANPVISMLPYRGDLGLDSGRPQSVFTLDTSGMHVLEKADGKPARVDLSLGRTMNLPGGGSVTFSGLDRWVKLEVSHRPGTPVALTGVVLALLGLMCSLFVRPRRVWVRARRESGTTVVEVAGLDRSGEADLDVEMAELLAALDLVADRHITTGQEAR